MASTPEEKPQRATAAQLANRKIKDVRRRRPNTATPSSAGASSNPFDTSASQPTNGFSFGQSQSFPGASSAPSQPTQNGTSSPFSFGGGSGGGGGSSSFNFASPSFGSGPAPSNPFASMSTGAPSQQEETNGFSGFKGNMFSLPPTGSQAPAQQALPSTGLFGQNNTTGGMFGSSSTPASSQPAAATPTATAGIFGQPAASSAAPSPSIFGQSSTSKPSAFGQSTAFGDDSMQTSPDAKGAAAASKPSIFGNGTPAAAPPVFGGLSSEAKPAASTEQTPSKPLFGAKPAEQATPATPLFGATTQSTSATPAASTPAPAPSASTPNLFGAKPADKPATPFQNPFQSTNLFSGAPAASNTPQEKEQEEKKASEPASTTPFQFGATNTGGASLFSKSASAAPAPASGGLFGVKPAFGASQPAGAGNLFAPKPAATTEQSTPKAPEGNPFGSLFAPKPATTQEKPEPTPAPAPAGGPFGSLFAPKPSTPAEAEKKAEPPKAAPAAPLFSASTPAGGAPNLFAPKPPSFPSSTTEPKTQTPGFTPAVPAPVSSSFKVNGTEKALSTKPAETQRFETLQPRKLPTDLSTELKDDAELLHRIRMLNECFKREITGLDPGKDDFDLIVQFYMRVRETIGAPTAGTKRKTRDDEETAADTHTQKKVKPFGASSVETPSSKVNAPEMNIAPSSITSTPSKLFGSSQTTPSKPAEENDGNSSTANIFAKSFSNSKSSESETAKAEAPRPSTPESSKPSMFSTTPTTSPAKPLFPTASVTKESTSTSTSLFSSSVSKPTTAAAPANPFAPKPAATTTSDSTSASAFQIPKFGGASGGPVDFLAQFKSQADKNAEKEKEKRKAEDFDSEEEDEAEWERRDAEEQRKKREEMESRSKKPPKFVPGKGFVFEDEDSEKTPEPKKAEDAVVPNGPSASAAGASVFDTKSKSSAKSSNIFGHLSATPSEVEENDADETDDAGDEASESESKGVSASESNDDGDLNKALAKSKQTTSDKTTSEDSATPAPASEGRSLFDRVATPTEEKKNPFGGLLGASKLPGPATPTLFASPSKPSSDQGSGSNVFGSSLNTGGLFATPAPATSGSSTGSIFGAKPGSDNTWKMNSPIKFAADSASASKENSGSTTPASDSSKPFSTLFGAPAGSKLSDSSSQKPLGFSFGGPSQQAPSVLAPSTLTSATPSGTSTPGASDTGANGSSDGDAVEALPQVDLARGGAGEEDEDVVFESRARGLQLKAGAGWESKGVGFLKILKNRETSRARILLRADPSGNIVLNAALMKAITYKASGNSVQFLVPQPEGPPESWAIRVKKEETETLASKMEETKA
ncbi:hypothetical protein ASPWEDRAFT_47121 [Aspergillus wentii DTO 134E9]|uniref:RanBD1 domain-containing protein n=1 Tax=Aspergillus wentii DTO 134E9 TaxID=1073089 RepID=A0A1L9RZB4_ASPWE|nr:uncharacterized protein ASPWEDRAFT_47121 [Aspergillus wentii DTO 134E9]KAI9932678.1 hypothetical protein MW887_008927 [Aspergillus wentii]OJJ40252.1 hypothetical protein ASPWEDRAFT_47121 [Aspergillus wentii DTO 134E9]